MAETKHYTIILTQNIDATQRQQIQAAVKAFSDEWWHEFADVWISYGSLTGIGWQSKLLVIFGHANGSFLALPLDGSTKKSQWGGFVTQKTIDWFEAEFNNSGDYYGEDPWASAPIAGSAAAGGYEDEPPF